MHLVTTTRLHLVAAFVAACTLTQQGFAVAALLLGLELLRVLARHHLDHTPLRPVTPNSACANQPTDVASEQAAVTRQPLAG
jgi:hypothetical protein